jgi:pyruvate dehydrogenase kinase 2/3/4
MYTTAEKPPLEAEVGVSDFKAPLAGYGYGLPISRLVSALADSCNINPNMS